MDCMRRDNARMARSDAGSGPGQSIRIACVATTHERRVAMQVPGRGTRRRARARACDRGRR
eukprot:5887981-Lingulodinium_polyedra.AAC.1